MVEHMQQRDHSADTMQPIVTMTLASISCAVRANECGSTSPTNDNEPKRELNKSELLLEVNEKCVQNTYTVVIVLQSKFIIIL